MPLFNKLQQILKSLRPPGPVKNPSRLDDAADDEMSAYGNQLKITKNDKKKRVDLLTPRERELYLLLLEGLTLKESAERLSVKYSTANTHMTGVYRKLGVSSRAELLINYRNVGLSLGQTKL
jgi:DNA-binding CsgD family transcriptional regulator